jgi:hypothetical protein
VSSTAGCSPPAFRYASLGEIISMYSMEYTAKFSRSTRIRIRNALGLRAFPCPLRLIWGRPPRAAQARLSRRVRARCEACPGSRGT